MMLKKYIREFVLCFQNMQYLTTDDAMVRAKAKLETISAYVRVKQRIGYSVTNASAINTLCLMKTNASGRLTSGEKGFYIPVNTDIAYLSPQGVAIMSVCDSEPPKFILWAELSEHFDQRLSNVCAHLNTSKLEDFYKTLCEIESIADTLMEQL